MISQKVNNETRLTDGVALACVSTVFTKTKQQRLQYLASSENHTSYHSNCVLKQRPISNQIIFDIPQSTKGSYEIVNWKQQWPRQ